MRKICIINQKGGVGKTTTTVNLAYGLAQAGKKVLILDLDAQGNISSCLPVKCEKDMHDFMMGTALFESCVAEINENLHVITSKETLTKTELILAGEPSREKVLQRKLKHLGGYDFVLLDCPPSLGLLNQNALLYSEEAIIPASTDVLGIDGLQKMMMAIIELKSVFNHALEVSAIVPTMYDRRTKVCKQALEKMKSDYGSRVAEPIRINSKLKEAPRQKKSIFEYAKSSPGAKDYKKLVQFVIEAPEFYEEAPALSAMQSEDDEPWYDVAAD
jgi:chromosome partitioning protein